MTARYHGSVLLLAAIFGVGTPAGIALVAAQAKGDIQNAAKAAKEAAKSVGEAGRDIGIATAVGAKQGAKAFKKSLSGRRRSHKRRVSHHTRRKAKTSTVSVHGRH